MGTTTFAAYMRWAIRTARKTNPTGYLQLKKLT
jgi:hypothetical protein